MKDRYISCYFSGRFDAFDGDVDLDKLVDKVNAGKPLRDVTMEAARAAITSEMDTSAKAQWLKDNVDEIKELGGDNVKAWQLYVQGRTDALAHSLEEDVVSTVEEGDDDEGESDESDDAEDDSEEEDEDA